MMTSHTLCCAVRVLNRSVEWGHAPSGLFCALGRGVYGSWCPCGAGVVIRRGQITAQGLRTVCPHWASDEEDEPDWERALRLI